MRKSINEIISKEELFPLVCEWIRSVLSRLGGDWHYSSAAGGFCWTLINDDKTRFHTGCARLCYDHWEVYSDVYKEENVNIEIFNDRIEFNEDSQFIDFTREDMYSLYTFLKERIFGNNTERLPEIIKDPTNVNIFKHIKSVMQRYPGDSPEYKVLYDLYNTIRCSFNTEYGMSVNVLKPDYEALITHATNLVNNFDKETESSDDIKEDK